eukprot:Gb_09876 [translate_table: standard]
MQIRISPEQYTIASIAFEFSAIGQSITGANLQPVCTSTRVYAGVRTASGNGAKENEGDAEWAQRDSTLGRNCDGSRKKAASSFSFWRSDNFRGSSYIPGLGTCHITGKSIKDPQNNAPAILRLCVLDILGGVDFLCQK